MKKIVLDTNFIVDLIRFKIDLEEISKIVDTPYKIFTIDKVLNELKSIDNKNAKAALKLIEVKKIKIIKMSEKNVDEALVALTDENTIVATNDSKLRKRLKSLGIKTIYLRKRKYLAIG